MFKIEIRASVREIITSRLCKRYSSNLLTFMSCHVAFCFVKWKTDLPSAIFADNYVITVSVHSESYTEDALIIYAICVDI